MVNTYREKIKSLINDWWENRNNLFKVIQNCSTVEELAIDYDKEVRNNLYNLSKESQTIYMRDLIRDLTFLNIIASNPKYLPIIDEHKKGREINEEENLFLLLYTLREYLVVFLLSCCNDFKLPFDSVYLDKIDIIEQEEKEFVKDSTNEPLPETIQLSNQKLKWKGTPSQFGFIIDLLIQGGYLEKPTSSFPKDANFYLQHFEINTTQGTLAIEVSENTNHLSTENRKRIIIPHKDKLK